MPFHGKGFWATVEDTARAKARAVERPRILNSLEELGERKRSLYRPRKYLRGIRLGYRRDRNKKHTSSKNV
jgi:hypothetical protein